MRYSLLSRFQGALLGFSLGEALGSYRTQRLSQSSASKQVAIDRPIELYRWQPSVNQLSSYQSINYQPTGTASGPLSPWGTLIHHLADELINFGVWSGKRWLPGSNDQLLAAGSTNAVLTVAEDITTAELAIVLLPISLFFHDDELKLRQHLSQTVWTWQRQPVDPSAVLAVGYAIAQALKERLDPQTLIPNVLAYLKAECADSDDPSTLITKLEQAQRLIDYKADLRTAIAELLPAKPPAPSPDAIALAFYCFLSTASDLRLSLIRAARCNYLPRLVCTLTGILSGAYNSAAAIPLAWRLAGSSSKTLSEWAAAEAAMTQLGTRLLAAWSGAYDVEAFSATLAIAAPNVIRPR